VNFELELSRHFKIYSIFHTSLLKSASDNISLIKIMNCEEYEDQENDKRLAQQQPPVKFL
jgi:hypothetical protein